MPKVFTSQKGFAPIFILIGLVVLVGVVVGVNYLGIQQNKINSLNNQVNQLTLTPTPTKPFPSVAVSGGVTNPAMADWKTYTNNSLGIYFQYPQEYSLKQTSAEQVIFSIESTDKSSFQLIIYNNPNNLSLKDFEIKYTGESGMGPNVYYPDAQLVKFQNIEAYYVRKEITCFSKCGSYVWTNKDKIYKLTGASPNKPNQKQILDQILSTFKFL